MGGGVGDQLQPLGLQPMGPQGTQYVAQPLRPVAQGEPPPVFQQPPGGGAQLLQSPMELHPGGVFPPPAARGKVGRVGHHQVEDPGGEGGLPPVPQDEFPRQAVGRQVVPGGPGGQGVPLHPGQRQPLGPPGQQQEERPAPGPQVAHPPPGPDGGELPQGQGVAPQGEHPLRPRQGIGPQLFPPHGDPSFFPPAAGAWPPRRAKYREKDTINGKIVL